MGVHDAAVAAHGMVPAGSGVRRDFAEVGLGNPQDLTSLRWYGGAHVARGRLFIGIAVFVFGELGAEHAPFAGYGELLG